MLFVGLGLRLLIRVDGLSEKEGLRNRFVHSVGVWEEEDGRIGIIPQKLSDV